MSLRVLRYGLAPSADGVAVLPGTAVPVPDAPAAAGEPPGAAGATAGMPAWVAGGARVAACAVPAVPVLASVAVGGTGAGVGAGATIVAGAMGAADFCSWPQAASRTTAARAATIDFMVGFQRMA